MVSSIGDPEAKGRGALLRLPEIMARTGMAEGTIRSRYHAHTFDVLWKMGRRLVVWERDLEEWLDRQREATRKTGGVVTPINWAAPFADILAHLPEDGVDLAQRALVREKVIRQIMRETGESREIVVETVDATASMGHEAVLDLVDGEPTTLRAALDALLERYDEDGTAEREQEADSPLGALLGELGAILAYPYPGVAGGHTLEMDDTEDETLIIRVDGAEVFRANHDEHGHAGMSAAEEAAKAVYLRLSE